MSTDKKREAGEDVTQRPNLIEILQKMKPLEPQDYFPDDIDSSLLPMRDINLEE